MSSAAQQIRLLVVDDDRPVLANLADGLEQAGYAVSRAATGEDAIRICAEAPPDLEITEEQLRVALQGDRNIGIATGILMERNRLTAAGAFETLRGRARARQHKLGEVAAEIVAACETVSLTKPQK